MGLYNPDAEGSAWQGCNPPQRSVFEKAIAEPEVHFAFSRVEIVKQYIPVESNYKDWVYRRVSEFHKEHRVDIEFNKYYNRRGLTAMQGIHLIKSFLDFKEGAEITKRFDIARGFSETSLAEVDLTGTVPYGYAMQALGFPEIKIFNRNRLFQSKQFLEMGHSPVRFGRVKEQEMYPWVKARLVYREEVRRAYEEIIGVHGEDGRGDH